MAEFTDKINCYNECPYYYYFNELNQYLCTDNAICPENYIKLIPLNKKCIDECNKDRIYKYDFNNTCYEQCPNGTIETRDFICEKEQDESIIYNCSNYDNLIDICSVIGINNNTVIYNTIINKMLSSYSINDKIQVFGGKDNTVYQLTSKRNELDLLNSDNLPDNYTLSIIDLGECENILKKEYNLNENDNLIILKQEKLSGKSSEKDIQFEVFEPYQMKKLNLSFCSSDSINIYVKLELSPELEALNEELQKLGFNMFDINNRFYTDICTPFKTSRKTDMILSDRIDDIYNNIDAQCQPNCQFSGYLSGAQYINCTCSVDIHEEKEKVKVEKFKPKKLYESFIDVLKYSNYKILKCYKLIGSKRMITKNIGNIMLIILFIVYIYSLISYIIKGVYPLKNRVIMEMKKEKGKGEDNKTFQETRKKNRKKEDKDKSNKKEKTKEKKKKKEKYNYPPKKQKGSNFRKSSKTLIREYTTNNENNNKYAKGSINIIYNQRLDTNKEQFITKDKTKERRHPFKYSEKDTNSEKYDDFELNELEYEEAARLDKRTLISIYYSLLKREHKILFTFFIHNDYNLFYIKIWRFVFLIASDMAMNALFFTDETMHKLYLTYGKYDFVQQIPQIVYSTIISQIFEVFLCYLSLTDTPFYEIKKLKISKDNSKKIKQIMKCTNNKLIIFYIFTLIFYIGFWYIIIIFCSVYENTQITYLKDCLFSFLLSIILPFVVYIIPSSLRVCAIRDEKIRSNCTYKLSEIIPFF